MTFREMEIAQQRKVTRRFIDADPYDVVLSRATMVPNGAGGLKKTAPSSLAAQRVRLMLQATQGRLEEAMLADGQVVKVDYHMVGDIGLDVERGDWFFMDGVKHEVVWVATVGEYEVKAGVTNRG
jgi:hypothetical protein